jgi:hypothetical protein
LPTTGDDAWGRAPRLGADCSTFGEIARHVFLPGRRRVAETVPRIGYDRRRGTPIATIRDAVPAQSINAAPLFEWRTL